LSKLSHVLLFALFLYFYLPSFQNVIQHTTAAASVVSSHLPSDLINIPTYSFATASAAPAVYTPNISQPEYVYTPSNDATYSSNNSGSNNSNYSPLYSAYPESSYSSSHTYLAATPLSPESHQGFTNMNIGTRNTFDDMESDLGKIFYIFNFY
jgi:hypothetical protein